MDDVFDYHENRKEELGLAVDHIIKNYYATIRSIAVDTILVNQWDDPTETEIGIAVASALAAMFKGFQDDHGEWRVVGYEPEEDEDARLFGSYTTEEEQDSETTETKETETRKGPAGPTRKVWKMTHKGMRQIREQRNEENNNEES